MHPGAVSVSAEASAIPELTCGLVDWESPLQAQATKVIEHNPIAKCFAAVVSFLKRISPV